MTARLNALIKDYHLQLRLTPSMRAHTICVDALREIAGEQWTEAGERARRALAEASKGKGE